jgi:hypothetical protein
MTYVIKIEGYVSSDFECPCIGMWLESFDHDVDGMSGHGTFTFKVNNAKRFDTKAEALIFWRKQSHTRPLRPDGQPNRPLTAFTISVEPLP